MAFVEKVMNMSAIATLILILTMSSLFRVGKSSPNTSINYLACNVNEYSAADAYAANVAYVLADMMNVTPNAGYDHYTHSPSSTAVSYGHATCSLALSYNDCADCLTAARSTVLSSCPSSIGASVEMVDCTMRYENYSF